MQVFRNSIVKIKKFFARKTWHPVWYPAPEFCERAGWYLLRRGVIHETPVYLAHGEYIEPGTEILFLRG